MPKKDNIRLLYRIIIECIAYLLILAIGYVDFHTDHEIFLAFFYLIPILMIAILSDRNKLKLTLVSVFCAGTWLSVDLTRGYEYNHPYIPYWNALGRFLIFIIVAGLYSIQEDQKEELLVKNRHLEEADRLKNEFLGIAAHDLRSPISIIKLYSDSALDAISSNEKDNQKLIPKSLEVICRNAGHVLDLLSDLLDIARIESGRLSLTLEKNDYTEFLDEIISAYGPKARKVNQDIVFLPCQLDKKVTFDRNMICQVLHNLLDNAVKYSPGNTKITIETRIGENCIETLITDQGQGIAEDRIGSLFVAFSKGDRKPVRGEKSTGLGLAIVKKIIEGHGGRVWVCSKIGEGAMFGFSLPL